MNFILTNARSLRPKFGAMVDAFESLNLDFLCATETWFKGGKDLNDALLNLDREAGLSIIHKSRDGRLTGRGGGVAIVFNKSVCNLKRRALGEAARRFEIVCATGRIKKISRKVAIFTYRPGSTTLNMRHCARPLRLRSTLLRSPSMTHLLWLGVTSTTGTSTSGR